MPAARTHRWVVEAVRPGVVRAEEGGERMISIPPHLLPPGVTEGQVLRVTPAPGTGPDAIVLTIAVDREGAAKALRKSKAAIKEAMDTSARRDPGGDVAL